MNIFIVRGQSESSDHYVAAFAHKPTDYELSDLCHSWDGTPDKDGPGFDGSYVHIEVIPTVLIGGPWNG